MTDDAQDRTSPRLEELVEPYLASCAAVNRPSTVQRKRETLRHLCRAMGRLRLDEIGPEEVERFRWARRREVSGPGVNRERATLSHLFNWARRLGYCEHNPVGEVPRFPENTDAWTALTPEQAERLLAACRRAGGRAPHIFPLVLLALYTGLRKGELLGLRWEDVDLEAGTLAAARRKTSSRSLLPLHPRASRVLEEWRERWGKSGRPGPWVFCHPDGTRLGDARRSFQTALRRAGLPRIRWHDLRHTFASWLVLGGADLFTVQELMGHQDLTMTRRYAHLSMDHKRRAIGRLEAVGGGETAGLVEGDGR